MRGAANSGKARHAAGRGGGGALCRPMKKLTPIMLAAALGGCLDAPPDTLAPTDDPALAEPADGVIPGEGETFDMAMAPMMIDVSVRIVNCMTSVITTLTMPPLIT